MDRTSETAGADAEPWEDHRLKIRGLSKRFSVPGRRPLEVIQNANLDIAPGEFVSLVGPSGCGKSTLLRLIAGIDGDYQGRIEFEGQIIEGPGLDRGIVFQDHRLLPWLTLAKNIELGLLNADYSAQEQRHLVQSHIELVGLGGFEEAWPHELSGGMAQRGAIARGLVSQPSLLLMDEPFGALDALTRVHLQRELLSIWRAEGISMLLVTHDVDEAIFLSNRVVVMGSNPGRIVGVFEIGSEVRANRTGDEFNHLKQQVLEAMGEISESVAVV